jgi:hypothetical protein
MLGSWFIGKKDHSNESRAPKEPVANGSRATEISEESDKAYESLARVLRCLGRHAFELDQLSEEDIEKEFERWARHVLVGAQIDGDDTRSREASPRRDWGHSPNL